MRRIVVLPVLAMVFYMAAPSADAGWIRDGFKSFGLVWKRNNAWPEPFIYPDRDSVEATMDVMIAKGWQQQNTLTSHHFDRESNKLNDAGRLKLDWIMAEAPAAYRSVFVERGVNTQVTSARVHAVRLAAQQMMPAGGEPPVYVNIHKQNGTSADQINSTYVKWRESQPAPVLPAATSIDN